MTRSAAEVEAEVEASRSELDRNMEALKQKMTPGQLFDEAARMTGGAGQQVASKFMEQAKANPMPLAVMGLGLAWLMASNGKSQAGYGGGYASSEPRSYVGETGYGAGWDGASTGASADGAVASLKDKAQGVGDKASDLLSGARDKLAGGAASLSDSGRSAAQGLSSMAGSVKQQASQAASQVGQKAQRTFLDTLESEPLLIAGLGIIVGAAIGAALPSTAAEDRTMGAARDKVLNKGKDLAQTGLQQAGSAAQAAYGSVKEELQNGGEDGQDLADRVEGAARSGVQAARDTLQQSQPH